MTRNARRFETRSGVDESARKDLVAMLNQSLADTTDLQTQVKHAHWNVRGMQFQQLHLLFDEFAEVLSAQADRIAERTAALGGEAMGTVRMAADGSRIDEIPADAIEGDAYVEALADRAGTHGGFLMANIDHATELGDPVTADMYTEIAHDLDKYRWFLEAHRQGEDAVIGQDVSLPADD